MLFGVSIICHILYCLVLVYYLNVSFSILIAWVGKEIACLSTIDLLIIVLFTFEGVFSSSVCLAKDALFNCNNLPYNHLAFQRLWGLQ